MQVAAAISERKKNVAIYSKETVVLVLINYTYQQQSWKSNVFMRGFSKDPDLVPIHKTVENPSDIIPFLPPCPQMFPIGKKSYCSC